MRALLLHCDAPAVAARAAEIGESAESLSSGIRLAEARLREIAAGRDLTVYRYRILPTWRIIRCDTATAWRRASTTPRYRAATSRTTPGRAGPGR